MSRRRSEAIKKFDRAEETKMERLERMRKAAEEMVVELTHLMFHEDGGVTLDDLSQILKKAMLRRRREAIKKYVKAEQRKMEKRLERMRKAAEGMVVELTHLMFLEDGVTLDDFSQTEIDKLKSYSRNKMARLCRQFGIKKPIGWDGIPKAAPEGRGDMKPSDDVEDELKKTYDEGESSKSGTGVDDDA